MCVLRLIFFQHYVRSSGWQLRPSHIECIEVVSGMSLKTLSVTSTI
jgi:hypothetical protein